MKRSIGYVKIAICAAFLALFLTATFFTGTADISAFKVSGEDAENPQDCRACHRQNYDSWHRTSHRKTVRKAAVETVQGDFERENRFEYNGLIVEMTRADRDFFVKIGSESYKVAAVVGTQYVEQYVAEKNGEFYSLPVAYNLSEKRWINLNDADFAGENADFSRHLKNFQTDCAACHQSGDNDFSDGFDDFGISCGACHGNAAEHLKSKNSWWAKIGFQTENKIVNPQNLSSDASMLACAQCHARDDRENLSSREITAEESPAATVSAHQTADFNSGTFSADGAARFSGGEYQAVLRSVCYVQSKAGGHGIAGEKISCASCHSPHDTTDNFTVSAKSFDQNCVNCHTQFADDSAIVEHTKHPLDSEASRCASCHQPEIVYGRMRFVRTHEISVPNPRLTAEKEIPNACNLCHTDESVNWAIASSKKLWSERFGAANISADRQFDQPESIRGLSSKDVFRRALAADALRKHSDSNRSAPFLFRAFENEKIPLVAYFLKSALESATLNSPADPQFGKAERSKVLEK